MHLLVIPVRLTLFISYHGSAEKGEKYFMYIPGGQREEA